MNKEIVTYTLESTLKFNTSFTCPFCNMLNNHEETINYLKSFKVDKNEDKEVLDNITNKYKEILNKKVINKFNTIKSLASNKNYSLIKNNSCISCNKLQPFAYNDKYKTKLIIQALFYIVIILISLILNIILRPVMQSIFNNVVSFFTSIFFFPAVFSIISIIFYIFDIKKIKKEIYKDNKTKSNLIIDNNYKLNFNLYDYNKEDRLNKH